MFEHLIDSNDHLKKTPLRKTLLFTVSALLSSVLTTLLIFSLFNQNLAMVGEIGSITRLMRPVALPEKAPLPQRRRVLARKKRPRASHTNVAIRRQNILRVDEQPLAVPSKISTIPSELLPRPDGGFNIGKTDTNPGRPAIGGMAASGPITGLSGKESARGKKPAAIKKISAPPKLPKPTKLTISKGPVNGIATYLPKPVYPAPARLMGVKGIVVVSVLIDETGSVISAVAVKGNPMLRDSSVRAARRSRFTPTTISGIAVKVRGVVNYVFH